MAVSYAAKEFLTVQTETATTLPTDRKPSKVIAD